MIDKELLAVLACPACRGDVACRDNRIVCVRCGRKYPIENGIPIMLVDKAQKD